jgi:hypothetical protein
MQMKTVNLSGGGSGRPDGRLHATRGMRCDSIKSIFQEGPSTKGATKTLRPRSEERACRRRLSGQQVLPEQTLLVEAWIVRGNHLDVAPVPVERSHARDDRA